MTVRRVFVIWTNSLFHESTRLLLKHPDIIWVGATTDYAIAHEAIMKIQPDTILFEKTKAGIPADLLSILEAENWELRIIGISLDNNEISLYHRENQTVIKAGDLLQFVLG